PDDRSARARVVLVGPRAAALESSSLGVVPDGDVTAFRTPALSCGWLPAAKPESLACKASASKKSKRASGECPEWMTPGRLDDRMALASSSCPWLRRCGGRALPLAR